MKKRILRYLKHTVVTLIVLGAIVISFGLYHGAALHYGDNPLMMDWDKEGPYVFYKNDSTLNVNYIKGNKDDGFYLMQKDYPIDSLISASCHFPLDSTNFTFLIKPDFKTPKTTYNDNNKVLAISDIESGYKTFRDFLISNKVIDNNLNWIFENGHLVLVGDVVERSETTPPIKR